MEQENRRYIMVRWFVVALLVVAVSGIAMAKEEPGLGDKPYVASPVMHDQGNRPNAVVFSEDFEGGVMPAGWTIVDGNADGFMWEVSTTASGNVYPPNCGTYFAKYDDDDAGSGSPITFEELYSPVINVSGLTQLTLSYSVGYNDIGSYDFFEVHVSFDGGAWNLLAQYTADISAVEEFDLTSFLPASTVQLFFYYYETSTTWAWCAAIDNVVLSEPEAPWEYTLIEEFDFNESDGGFVHLCPPNDPLTCPDGIDDWQWGAAVAGAGGPSPGELTCEDVPLTNCWGTVLAGNYNNNSCSRLVSPVVALPDTCDSLVLEVCHWYDIESNYDGGNVVVFDPPDPFDAGPAMNPIYPSGGKSYDATISTSASFFACLTDLEDGFTSHMSPPWYQSFFDISVFGGTEIRFGFDFGSDASVTYPGWYIKWAKVWCVREPVAVDENMTKDIHGYILNQAVPNPFTGMTNIAFTLPQDASMNLKVFDASGRVIRTLASSVMPAGSHTVTWDGRDESGVQAPAGIYFYRMQAGQFDAIRKLILVR
jgi:hypothetical protein